MAPQLKKITLTGDGSTQNSTAFKTDWKKNTQISLGLDTDGSTTGATVQHTFDNGDTIDAGNATWFDHAELASQTAKADGNYAFPVQAIRLQLDDQGTDTWELWILQSSA